MKFGKRLQSQIEETMPEWRDKFLCYKQLKKRLKLMSAPACFTEAAFDTIATSPPWGGGGVVYQTRSSCVVDEVDQQLRSNAFTTTTHSYMGGGQNVSMVSDSLLETASSSVEHAFLDDEGLEAKTIVMSHHHHHHPIRHVGGAETEYFSSSELDFVGLLNKELNKFNHFFIEKEEEYVIRLQELKDRIVRVKKERRLNGGRSSKKGGKDDLLKIYKDIVTFHGEMVLLENYSSLNYTGLVKILKKHDKRTGAVLRLPFIQSVLLQPFFTTELLSELVRECENNLHSLFPVSPIESICTEFGEESSEFASLADEYTRNEQEPSFIPGEAVETIYRSTVVALRTIREIRHSSTRSMFSLPPINRFDCEEKFGVVIDEMAITPVAVTQ